MVQRNNDNVIRAAQLQADINAILAGHPELIGVPPLGKGELGHIGDSGLPHWLTKFVRRLSHGR